MSVPAMIAAVSLVAVAFLGLALAGAVRALDRLRLRVEALETAGAIDHPPVGLPVGAPAPIFAAKTLDGATFHSDELTGRRHVVALADLGCAACDRLVPDLLASAARGELPPSVVVVGGREAGPWILPIRGGGRAFLVLDADRAVADAFGSGFTPHVFVVDEGGSVASRGPAGDLPSVRRLLREAEGVRILRADPAEVLDG